MKEVNGSLPFATILSYVIVGILWGCTNPFIKYAQAKHNDKRSNSILNILKRFFTDPLLFLPFLLNQSGSFFFYYIISTQPISIASPICNALSFIFTAITGYWFFKEELQSLSTLVIGIFLILLGSYICITST